jgi:cell division transport system ATP-binding protein
MSDVVLNVSGVSKRFGGLQALSDVGIQIQRGQVYGLIGPNGAGKTTLLKLLFAMEDVSEGSIYVNSREIARLAKPKVPGYRQEVGFVFQDFKLLPDLTVAENVALPLEIRKMPKAEIEYRAKGVLQLVGLADRAQDYPNHLSGGEQQRVVIARSIIGKPALLLADEPTGNLDNQTAREIMSLFREINEMGTTVLIATHDESLMNEFPARTIELKKGMMISDRGGNA